MKKSTGILICLFVILLAVSCRTQRQIQTEYLYIHDTDTVTQIKLRLDSVVISDSVIMFVKGDTVYKEKYHTEYRDRLRVDTLKLNITKKLYYTKEKEVIKEVNRLYWWQKVIMSLGVAFFLFFIIWGLSKIKLIF